jgi:hypothetical protein
MWKQETIYRLPQVADGKRAEPGYGRQTWEQPLYRLRTWMSTTRGRAATPKNRVGNVIGSTLGKQDARRNWLGQGKPYTKKGRSGFVTRFLQNFTAFLE